MRSWVSDQLKKVLPISLFDRWNTVLGYGVARDRARRQVKINATRIIEDMVKARKAGAAAAD